ncbi:glycoside hydrolase family 3 N-terminal domain-containing protein [Oenococcus sp.]|uniref:glycoside hydrolase family 3 N-terminal domain-containing protein n=1 Tax=Oenococcus sp. TaxID=1979414 RepID=UPI0039E7CBA1
MQSNYVKQLLSKMTLQEKIGQLQQIAGDFFGDDGSPITGPLSTYKVSKTQLYNIGSVLGVSGAENVLKIQREYLKNNRLHIPLIFMADIIHGYKTIFPIPLALGSTWDPELVKRVAQASAAEASASGIDVTFSPMVDLVHDPRWGRVMESTGEDPYLNSLFAKSFVDGYQGNLPVDEKHVAATVKHFAAYGAPEAGREYNTVDMSEWRFREQYLPAYQKAIESKALLVMTSFNILFGIPATGNKYLMRHILRRELGFNGVLISDWNAINEMISHGVASDSEEAAEKAIQAGTDIDMMSFAFLGSLEKLAMKNEEVKKLIDEAAARVLNLKDALGLFDDPYRGVDAAKERQIVLSQENLGLAKKAAEEATVLLKNQHQSLPLDSNKAIALIGSKANTGDLLGNWSWKGDPASTQTIKSALEDHFDNILFEAGYDMVSAENNLSLNEQAISSAKKQDVILYVAGLSASQSGEASSMTDISLPKEQLDLLRKLSKLHKPIITIVITGRPLDLTEVDRLSDAILLPWFPGTAGALAIADIVSGKTNPTGRLSMTFPKSVGQIPIYYNYYNTGRPLTGTLEDRNNIYLSKYIDSSNDPLYPFGFGLSYSNYTLKDLRLSKKEFTADESITASVTVKNNSKISGTATVQWYIHDLVGEVVRPVKELKHFQRVQLGAGAEETVTFTVSKQDLSYVHADFTRVSDAGSFKLLVGFSSQTELETSFLFKN